MTGKELWYNQATHVTFMCPIRFNKFPLDSHICTFRVGSPSYDDTRMTFSQAKLLYNKDEQNPVLDYFAEISELPLQ